MSKLKHNSSTIVGTGVVSRGGVGLIIAGAGLTTEAISRASSGAKVSIDTISVAPFLMGIFLKRQTLDLPASEPPSADIRRS